ncbi:MAG: hypothetical protein Q8P91_02255 [bacterium]|nr:hypothetical protein [bacterium]
MLLRKINYNLIFPGAIFLLAIFVQNFNLGKLVNVFTDEGVYLYGAKLLSDGHLIYRDFFFGHPPYLVIVPALFFKIIGLKMNLFHLLYTVWFYSSLFPIFLITNKISKSRFGATLALIIFCTYQELVQWGTHQFDLRQMATPFLAFSLYFIYVKFSPKVAAILLAFFAIGIVSNLPLSVLLIVLLLLGDLLFGQSDMKSLLKKYRAFLIIFFLIVVSGYFLILLIPNGYKDVIGYQLGRPFLPYDIRYNWMKENILDNWPVFLFGLLGSFFSINKKYKLFGLFNIIGLPLVVFLGPNYYPHYLVILAPTLAITSGLAIAAFSRLNINFAVLLLVIFGIYTTSYQNLKYQLIEKKTPEFFRAVEVLKGLPEPLFTFEPVYGLYADKNLTFHYYASDMRYFRVTGKNLTDLEYRQILDKSKTVLIEPFARSVIPSTIVSYISNNYRLVYSDQDQQIYAKK